MEWEYFTHRIDIGGFISTGEFNAQSFNDVLNWYGTQRWELVSTFTTAHNHGGTMHIGLIFKRPKPSAPPMQPQGGTSNTN